MEHKPFKDFKKDLTERGFLFSTRDYMSKDWGDDLTPNQSLLGHHPDGVLVYANSFTGKVNAGELYFEVAVSKKTCDMHAFHGLRYSTLGMTKETLDEEIWLLSLDVRYNPFGTLEKYKALGRLVTPWVCKDRFLWFVDPDQSPGHQYSKDFDYDKVTKDRIESGGSPDLRKLIGR